MKTLWRVPGAFPTLLLLALLWPPFPVYPDPVGTRVLYKSDGVENPAWSESLAAALARSEALDAILPAPEGMEAAEAAARLSCVLAVHVASSLATEGYAFSDWSILDPLTRSVIAEGRIEGPAPTDRELNEFWWIPVVEAAEAALPKARRTLVRVEARPGTVLEGLGEGPLTIPPEGVLELPLRVPATYAWRSEARGAYPEHGYFSALGQGQVLSIPYRPLPLWTLETGLTMMEFPDVWVARRFKEDTLFLRFGLSQYLLGVYLVDEEYDQETPNAILSLPLVMPGVGFGGYFLPPDSSPRPYIAATVFARVILEKGYTGFDPAAPLGVFLAGGAEWRLFPRTGAFVELGANLYPFCQGFLLASSRLGNSESPSLLLYGGRWLLELPMLRLGLRLTL